MFLTGRHFETSLFLSVGSLQILPERKKPTHKNGQVSKCQPGRNTLAYFAGASMAKKKVL